MHRRDLPPQAVLQEPRPAVDVGVRATTDRPNRRFLTHAHFAFATASLARSHKGELGFLVFSRRNRAMVPCVTFWYFGADRSAPLTARRFCSPRPTPAARAVEQQKRPKRSPRNRDMRRGQAQSPCLANAAARHDGVFSVSRQTGELLWQKKRRDLKRDVAVRVKVEAGRSWSGPLSPRHPHGCDAGRWAYFTGPPL